MKNQKKKGFTIVELVIVIAVIAILAAILIPIISNLVRRARVVYDSQLVRNLNTALAMDKEHPKHETMQQALDAAEAYGYDVAKINASALDNMILWDSVNDVFCYMEKAEDGTETITYIPESVDKVNALSANDYRLWVISNVVSDNYSTYYTGTATNVTVTKGFDAGINDTLLNINYVHETTNPAEKQDVVIRTNSASTNLTINAPVDTVKHYDAVGSLTITAVANASYHEYGQVAFAEIATGRIVLESESKVEHIHLNTSEVNNETVFNNITVAKASDVEMPEFSRDPVEIPEEGKLVVALQNGTETTDDKDFVWLTAVGVYEQVTVSSSSTAAGNNYAAESNDQEKKDTAQQIANNISVNVGGDTYTVKAEKTSTGWDYKLVDETEQVSAEYSVSGTPVVTVTTQTVEQTTTTTTTVTVSVVDTNEAAVSSTPTIENGLSEAAKEEKQTELVNEAKAPEVAKEYAENGDALIYNLTTGVYYNDLYTALDEVPASTKTTLILLKDITGVSNKNYVVKANQIIVFDLNGCKFNTVAPDGSTAYAIENLGTLTIKDNTDKNKNGTGNGKLELNALDPDTLDIPGYASNVITNRGTLVIESGWIHNASSNGMAAFAIDNDSRATGTNNKLVVNGGKITTAAALSIRQCVLTGSTSDVIINGGVVGSYWIQNYGNATTSATGTLTINNVEALYGYRLDLGYSIDYGFNIKGENIIVAINGGNFKSLTVYSKNNAKTDIIKGGKFTNNVSAYCKEGYFTKEVNGKYEVRPISQATNEDFVAFVGEQGYLDYELAKEAANGNAIKLNKDLRGYLMFNDGGTYVLDLNGHNIVNYSGSGNSDTVNVYNNTTLTITDSSSGEKGTISSEVGVAIWTGSPATDTSSITINGGVKLIGSTHSIQSSGGNTTIIINNAVITGDFDINGGSTLTDNR